MPKSADTCARDPFAMAHSGLESRILPPKRRHAHFDLIAKRRQASPFLLPGEQPRFSTFARFSATHFHTRSRSEMPNPFDLDAYFARINYAGPRTATYDAVAGILQAHISSIPFESFDVLLGRPLRLDHEGL